MDLLELATPSRNTTPPLSSLESSPDARSCSEQVRRRSSPGRVVCRRSFRAERRRFPILDSRNGLSWLGRLGYILLRLGWDLRIRWGGKSSPLDSFLSSVPFVLEIVSDEILQLSNGDEAVDECCGPSWSSLGNRRSLYRRCCQSQLLFCSSSLLLTLR